MEVEDEKALLMPSNAPNGCRNGLLSHEKTRNSSTPRPPNGGTVDAQLSKTWGCQGSGGGRSSTDVCSLFRGTDGAQNSLKESPKMIQKALILEKPGHGSGATQ